MDIYRPKGVWGELPAIVCIHGGGWAKGNRRSHAKISMSSGCPRLRGGVPTVLAEKLRFLTIQDYPGAAVRFLRANAKELGIDPDKIGAIGLSGGQTFDRFVG